MGFDLDHGAGQVWRAGVRVLGEQSWRESGLGAPADGEQLQRRITALEQQVVDLTGQLEERDQDLEAARGANRELITQMNTMGTGTQSHR